MDWLFDQKKLETKMPALIKAALKLFVKNGVEATTTRQIADAAGVSEGTIYRHFKSKDQMANNIFVTYLEAFTKELDRVTKAEKSSREKIRAAIHFYFSFFEAERTLFEYILASEHRDLQTYPASLRHPTHVLNDILSEAMKNKELPKKNVMLGSAYIIGIVTRVSIYRIFKAFDQSLVELVDEITDACWRAVGGK